MKKEEIKSLTTEIKQGTHAQFVLDSDSNKVYCKCGHVAVFWQTGYLCGTITAYPCKFNKN
jgi:hypothetical protein